MSSSSSPQQHTKRFCNCSYVLFTQKLLKAAATTSRTRDHNALHNSQEKDDLTTRAKNDEMTQPWQHLEHLGLKLRAECWNGQTNTDMATALEQFLHSDIRGLVLESSLPSSEKISLVRHGMLRGNLVVQVLSFTDISQPRKSEPSPGRCRMLKVYLTDGIQEFVALEYRSIPSFSSLQPGMKLIVRDSPIRNGLLMLVPQNVDVLGGVVAALLPTTASSGDATINQQQPQTTQQTVPVQSTHSPSTDHGSVLVDQTMTSSMIPVVPPNSNVSRGQRSIPPPSQVQVSQRTAASAPQHTQHSRTTQSMQQSDVSMSRTTQLTSAVQHVAALARVVQQPMASHARATNQHTTSQTRSTNQHMSSQARTTNQSTPVQRMAQMSPSQVQNQFNQPPSQVQNQFNQPPPAQRPLPQHHTSFSHQTNLASRQQLNNITRLPTTQVTPLPHPSRFASESESNGTQAVQHMSSSSYRPNQPTSSPNQDRQQACTVGNRGHIGARTTTPILDTRHPNIKDIAAGQGKGSVVKQAFSGCKRLAQLVAASKSGIGLGVENQSIVKAVVTNVQSFNVESDVYRLVVCLTDGSATVQASVDNLWVARNLFGMSAQDFTSTMNTNPAHIQAVTKSVEKKLQCLEGLTTIRLLTADSQSSIRFLITDIKRPGKRYLRYLINNVSLEM